MAKKGGRRRGIKHATFNSGLAVGALASADLIGATLLTNGPSDKYLVSGDFLVAYNDHTAGEGPMSVGVAHGDYSDAEIEEWLEQQASLDESDKIAQEQGRRLCRKIGMFSGNEVSEMLNNGTKIRIPLRFKLRGGELLRLWVANEDNTILATGTIVSMVGDLFYRDI